MITKINEAGLVVVCDQCGRTADLPMRSCFLSGWTFPVGRAFCSLDCEKAFYVGKTEEKNIVNKGE